LENGYFAQAMEEETHRQDDVSLLLSYQSPVDFALILVHNSFSFDLEFTHT
jgi:hypothetical protein